MTSVRFLMGALGHPPKKVLFYPKMHFSGKKVHFAKSKKFGEGHPRIFLVYCTLDFLSTFHVHFEVGKYLGGPQRPLEKDIFGLKIDHFLTFGSKKHNI